MREWGLRISCQPAWQSRRRQHAQPPARAVNTPRQRPQPCPAHLLPCARHLQSAQLSSHKRPVAGAVALDVVGRAERVGGQGTGADWARRLVGAGGRHPFGDVRVDGGLHCSRLCLRSLHGSADEALGRYPGRSASTRVWGCRQAARARRRTPPPPPPLLAGVRRAAGPLPPSPSTDPASCQPTSRSRDALEGRVAADPTTVASSTASGRMAQWRIFSESLC